MIIKTLILITYGQRYRNVMQSINYILYRVPTKSNCVLCRKFRAATIQPIIADFPERLAYQSPAFTNTAVDYFGPFYVTVRRTTEKRCQFLFTRLSTHALHVEVVPRSWPLVPVMGVERFVSRRGTAAIIWPDNCMNFIGAEKELRWFIENGVRSALPLKLLIRALSGGLTRPGRHSKVASGRSWSAV